MESGEFCIEIGRSSRDIVLTEKVSVESTVTLPKHYDMNSIFMDLMNDPRAETILEPVLKGFRESFLSSGDEQSDAAQEAITNEMSLAMFNYMPLRTILSFAGEKADPTLLDQILTALNS